MTSFGRWTTGIMLLGGALTFTTITAAISPDQSMQSTFGEPAGGPATTLVVRSWGVLVALIGAMLMYGAFRPAVRRFVLVVAGLSKAAFVALVLAHGTRYLGHQAGIAVALDSVLVILFAVILVAGRPESPA